MSTSVAIGLIDWSFLSSFGIPGVLLGERFSLKSTCTYFVRHRNGKLLSKRDGFCLNLFRLFFFFFCFPSPLLRSNTWEVCVEWVVHSYLLAILMFLFYRTLLSKPLFFFYFLVLSPCLGLLRPVFPGLLLSVLALRYVMYRAKRTWTTVCLSLRRYYFVLQTI